MNDFSLPDRFFITGTDTGVGKTLISSLLMLGLQSCYYKPVQSGTEEDTDTTLVQRLSGLDNSHFLPETYRTRTPCSPHLSARIDEINIDLGVIVDKVKSLKGHLIVEGAGGIFVPLNDKEFILDLMQTLNLPVLLVARSGLGTINHTLLSIKALRHAGLDLLGVVLNGAPNLENRKAIESFGNVRVLAEIPTFYDFSRNALWESFQAYFGGAKL